MAVCLEAKTFRVAPLGTRSSDPTVSFNPIGKHHLNEVTRVIDENKHLQICVLGLLQAPLALAIKSWTHF